MSWLKANNLTDIFKHLLIIVAILFLLVSGLFYFYLPSKTNHGESITVPDLTGLKLEELDQFLLDRNLRYEINDSSYEVDMAPLTVLRQFPKPGARVKENRKIYITINRETPPLIRLPETIINYSLKNAIAVLESNELKRGKIEYVPYPLSNLVLEMKVNGRNKFGGDRIPKGTSVDLVVGNGSGNAKFSMEDLMDYSLDDAKVMINGSGLKLGLVTGQTDSTDANWIISRQVPEAGATVSVGQFVDLWVKPYDSLSRKNEPGSLEEKEDNEN